MKKLIIAGAAMLAASCISGNAFAVAGSDAKGLQAGSSVTNVACGCYHRHHYRHHATHYVPVPVTSSCGCGGFGLGMGGCGGGCGCGGGFFGIF